MSSLNKAVPEKLANNFYKSKTLQTAKNLLGKYLVRKYKGKIISGMIVETEAYTGKKDPGSHAYKSRTPRNEPMFGPPGRAYVYFCYGNHYLFNIVTEKEGTAGAVLIRALEPKQGIETMKKLRKTNEIIKLTNGPGKLTQALAIDRDDNRADLNGNELYVASGMSVPPSPRLRRTGKHKIASGSRIGIKQGLDKKWRFWIKDNEYVSVK